MNGCKLVQARRQHALDNPETDYGHFSVIPCEQGACMGYIEDLPGHAPIGVGWVFGNHRCFSSRDQLARDLDERRKALDNFGYSIYGVIVKWQSRAMVPLSFRGVHTCRSRAVYCDIPLSGQIRREKVHGYELRRAVCFLYHLHYSRFKLCLCVPIGGKTAVQEEEKGGPDGLGAGRHNIPGRGRCGFWNRVATVRRVRLTEEGKT